MDKPGIMHSWFALFECKTGRHFGQYRRAGGIQMRQECGSNVFDDTYENPLVRVGDTVNTWATRRIVLD
jgi:hypothetical protein